MSVVISTTTTSFSKLYCEDFIFEKVAASNVPLMPSVKNSSFKKAALTPEDILAILKKPEDSRLKVTINQTPEQAIQRLIAEGVLPVTSFRSSLGEGKEGWFWNTKEKDITAFFITPTGKAHFAIPTLGIYCNLTDFNNALKSFLKYKDFLSESARP